MSGFRLPLSTENQRPSGHVCLGTNKHAEIHSTTTHTHTHTRKLIFSALYRKNESRKSSRKDHSKRNDQIQAKLDKIKNKTTY